MENSHVHLPFALFLVLLASICVSNVKHTDTSLHNNKKKKCLLYKHESISIRWHFYFQLFLWQSLHCYDNCLHHWIAVSSTNEMNRSVWAVFVLVVLRKKWALFLGIGCLLWLMIEKACVKPAFFSKSMMILYITITDDKVYVVTQLDDDKINKNK